MKMFLNIILHIFLFSGFYWAIYNKLQIVSSFIVIAIILMLVINYKNIENKDKIKED